MIEQSLHYKVSSDTCYASQPASQPSILGVQNCCCWAKGSLGYFQERESQEEDKFFHRRKKVVWDCVATLWYALAFTRSRFCN